MGRNEGRRRRRRGDQIALRAVSAFAGVGSGAVDTELEQSRRRRRPAGGAGVMGGVNMPRSRRNLQLNSAELVALRAARSGTLRVSTASPQALKAAVRNLTRRGLISAEFLGGGRRSYAITDDGQEILRRR